MPPKSKSFRKKTKTNKPKARQQSTSRAGVPPGYRNSQSRVPQTTLLRQNAIEKVCAVTDPFCYQAKGSKWPDGNGSSSLPFQLRGHFQYNTLASGNSIFYITPSLNYSLLGAVSYSGPNYTMATSLINNPGMPTGVLNLISEYRIVTAGVVLRNLPSAMNTSGFITITRMSSQPNAGATVPSGGVYGVQSVTHPLQAGMEVPVIFRSLGNVARDFLPTTLVSGSNPSQSAGWDTIQVEILGGLASTATLDIEFVYNVEIQLTTANEFIQSIVPVTAPSSPTIVKMADKAAIPLADLAHKSVQSFGKTAVKLIGSFFGPVASSVVSALVD